MIDEKIEIRFAKAVKNERFAFKNKDWFGYRVVCGPLFCSYGKCGYTIDFYDLNGRWLESYCYDWDYDSLYRDGDEDENLLKAI